METEKSPTALKMLKYAFHGETDGVVGISNLGVGGLSIYCETDESLEGKTAFVEKRRPDYSRFRGRWSRIGIRGQSPNQRARR